MNDSQLKYYFPPDLTKPNNLSVNYEKYISRDLEVDEHIDALLDALICIRDKEEEEMHKTDEQTENMTSPPTGSTQRSHDLPQQRISMTKADFICYRGILTKIMCTPYTRNEPWELGATLYKGSIYIEEHVSEEKRKNAGGSNDRHKLMSYWGYRFETICCIDKPVSELRRLDLGKLETGVQESSGGEGDATSEEPTVPSLPQQQTNNMQVSDGQTDQIDPNDPELLARLDNIVDTNLQYCTVARTKIGNNSIIMGAEIDCTSEPKQPSPHNPLSNYIELKTSRVISNKREESNFERHKLLKFWAQSFLPGVPTIIVGFRDDDGKVVQVQTFKTMEIPRLVRGKEGAWDSTICINFLDSVLSFLKTLIVKDDPSLTYTIRWAYPFRAVEVEFAGPKNPFLTARFLERWSK
ncbi:hypothetical protein BGZ94_009545 [Podila epigama]|nr:hypothetical protein BGZ94_009545 [Podila epigama]